MLQSSKKNTVEHDWSGGLVYEVKNHPNKDALIADLQSNHPYNPFSEESQQMLHTMWNVKCFELCEISPNVQCPYCMMYWTEGIVRCGAYFLFPPNSHEGWIGKDSTHWPSLISWSERRHAIVFATGKLKHNTSIAKRGIVQEKHWRTIAQSSSGSNRAKRTEVRRRTSGGTKKLANVLTELHAKTIHTSLLGNEIRRYENDWKLALNTRGPVGPMKARSDYSDAVKTIRDLRQKDDHEANSSIPPANKCPNVQCGETRCSHSRNLKAGRSTQKQMDFVVFARFSIFFDKLERIIHLVVFPTLGRTLIPNLRFFQGFRLQAIAVPL